MQILPCYFFKHINLTVVSDKIEAHLVTYLEAGNPTPEVSQIV
jgi:hypothetical protein